MAKYLPFNRQLNTIYNPDDEELNQGMYFSNPNQKMASDDNVDKEKPEIKSQDDFQTVLNKLPVNEPPSEKQRNSVLDSIGNLFKGDTYINYTLPVLGILETIATQGQSKGETALTAQTRAQETKLYKQKEEEIAAENAAKQEERYLNSLKRKQGDIYQSKIQELDRSDPEYYNKAANLYIQYHPEDIKGAIDLKKSLGKPLTSGELESMVKVYGEDMRDAIMTDPDKFRSNLPMASVNAQKIVETPQQKAASELDVYGKKSIIDLQKNLALEKERARLRKEAGGVGGKVIGYDDNGVPIYGDKSQRLSQTTVKGMAEFKNFPTLLNDLRQTIEKDKVAMGPISGRATPLLGKLGVVNDATMKASELNAKYEAVKQVVAKGLEGGVLRKEDMPKYEKILGDITLKPEFAQQNLNNLEKMLISNYTAYTTGLEASGYFVPPEVKISSDNVMTKTTQTTNTPSPKTQAEYNAIPSGTLYIDTDGQTKRKK
jgi:hypothetical protein